MPAAVVRIAWCDLVKHALHGASKTITTPAPTDLATSRSSDTYRISWLEGDERIVIETSTRPLLMITLSFDEQRRQ